MSRSSQSIMATALAASLLALSACGDEDQGGGSKGGSTAYCPLDKSGEGSVVSSRYEYQDLLEAGKWRSEIFPRDCAGALGALIPDIPDGYGLAPNSRPYIMNPEHVFLRYAETKGAVDNPDGPSSIPPGNSIISFEISRYSPEELAMLRQWMLDNPSDFLTRTVDGETVYLMAGVGIFFQQRTIRVPAGLTAIYDDGLLIRLNHSSMFSNQRDTPVDPTALSLMIEMIQRAEGSGK